MREWRLIVDATGDGPWQMAVDAAVQESVISGSSPPTLRLYRFVPACVTIGKFQDSRDVDSVWCRENGIGVARRPTGGRGVLHDDELTYAIVAGTADGVPRGVAASYRHLCQGLVAAYANLGVEVQLSARERGEGPSGACYLHATRADLSVRAAKITGSAQVWRDDVCLQHGSFVRSRDIAREATVFRLSRDETARMAGRTSTISDVVETVPDFETLGHAVATGVSAGLGVELVAGALSEEETELASEWRDRFQV